MPNSRLLPRCRFEDQVAGPGLVDLVAVRVADQLGCAGGAAGMEVGGDITGGDLPAADQPVGRLLADQRVERMDAVGRIARPVDLHDGLQVRQAAAHLHDLLPDVGALGRPERDQHLGLGRLEDLGDLVRFEQRIDQVDDACLRAEQRGEQAPGQQRQQKLTTSPGPTPSP